MTYSETGVPIKSVSEKLVSLAYCMGHDWFEDAAGHLCDLLEYCRKKIRRTAVREHSTSHPAFADLLELVKCYGEHPTPVMDPPDS